MKKKTLSDGDIKTSILLPVKNPEQSLKFFTGLGFVLHGELSNNEQILLAISDTVFLVLIAEPVFAVIGKRNIADTNMHREIIVQLTVANRAAVDRLVDTALTIGGRIANDPNDQGFLYGRSFEDPDGHMWDVFYIDTKSGN